MTSPAAHDNALQRHKVVVYNEPLNEAEKVQPQPQSQPPVLHQTQPDVHSDRHIDAATATVAGTVLATTIVIATDRHTYGP